MAANDEIPRGYTLQGEATGNEGVVFPAIPGISWTLTAVTVNTLALAAGSHGAPVTVTNVFPATEPLGICWLASNSVIDDSASFEWEGSLAAPPGESLTVDFNSNDVNVSVYMTATAYPT